MTLRDAGKLIVRHVLEGDVPISACSQCEVDHGIMDRTDMTKSHGLCKRHMLEWAREGGLTENQIREIFATTTQWPPDLGPVPVRENAGLTTQCSYCKKFFDPATGMDVPPPSDPSKITHGSCKRCRNKWAGEMAKRANAAYLNPLSAP